MSGRRLMSGRVAWKARKSTGFVLMIGAMVILVVATWSAIGIMAEDDAVTAESKYQFRAVAAGQAVIRESRGKAFDQGTIAGNVPLPDDLTDAARLGPEPGESASTTGTADTEVPGAGFNSTVMFNDVDDYNGYRRMVHTGEAYDLLLEVTVSYALPTAPDSLLSFRSPCKRMSVRVSQCDGNGSVPPKPMRPVELRYAFFSPASVPNSRN